MPLDAASVARGCRGASVETARHLCRSELDRFRSFVAGGEDLVVGCTQEAPLFSEAAEELESGTLTFANIRENAGWSSQAAKAGPKMAALLAVAAEDTPEVPFYGLSSEGVVLIYGRDERAIEAGEMLKDHLDVTVMIAQPRDIAPPRVTDFPVVKGTIRNARGHFGAFEISVDDYAPPLPSSRGSLRFGPARDAATSRCDIILDLSGTAPLFPAADLREGYLRADPADAAGLLRAVWRARDLVGSFDKPRFIAFDADLCAHRRSRIVGCRRCLDLCPAGAIAAEDNATHVTIDPGICAGCGQCAAACPTGAAAYTLPPADTLLRKLRTLFTAYREAGGARPVLLVHDRDHGDPLIEALARYGDGLPANVLPFAVNEVTQVGLEAIAAAFAYGAVAIRMLLRAKPRHDVSGLGKTLVLAEPILAGLGFGSGRVATIETDDPDMLGSALAGIDAAAPVATPAGFIPVGPKREVMRLALRELHRAAPAPVDVIALPEGAPFGSIAVHVEGCTLCMSCVSACPTGALLDNPERPMLRFAEDACVQCGLCKATCPEKVIALTPQIDFRAATAAARIVKQEEPFPCIACGKPFGVKSTIERVAAKLEGKHWMFKNSAKRLDLIKMCDDCRVAAVTAEDFDPYGAPRPNPRTTEDYLREREELMRQYERGEKG
ncbi:MAG: 4Fe-4S dicluster domain-containing protein [Pseudorhodoplanes sp.]